MKTNKNDAANEAVADKSESKAQSKGSVKKMFKTKSFRAGGYSTLAVAIVIIIAVVLNLIVSNISTAYTNIDTTVSKYHTLSAQTKTILSSLEKDVTVYYVVSSGNEDNDVKRLTDKFAAAGNHLKVQYVDPDIEPEFVSQHTDDKVSSGDLLVVCGDKSQVVHHDDMIEFEAGSYENYMYYLQNNYQTGVYWKGEIKLLKAVDFVSSTTEYKVYFLSLAENTDFSSMTQALENENISSEIIYDAEDISIPTDAACVIITNLAGDISAHARTAVEKYLARGGKVYIAADHTDENTDNLTAILNSYGIAFTSSVLKDGDNYENYDTMTKFFTEFTGEHAIISPFARSNYILFSSAMGITSVEKENITVTPILKTSESAFLSSDSSDDLHFSEFNVAVVVDDSSTGAQLTVFGTSDYTSSDNMDNSFLSNVDLFLNSVGYLCDKDSAISVHAKAITTDNTLDFSHASTKLITFFVAVVPALLSVIIGFAVWYRRKNS